MTLERIISPSGRKEGLFTLFFILLLVVSAYLYSIAQNFVYAFLSLINITMCWSAMVILWNSRRELKDNFFLSLNAVLFVASFITLVYTAAISSNGTILAATANQIAQLWTVAGAFESLMVLLHILMYIKKPGKVNDNSAFLFFILGFTVVVFTHLFVFVFKSFPQLYEEGAGYSIHYHTTTMFMMVAWFSAAVIVMTQKLDMTVSTQVRLVIFLFFMFLTTVTNYVLMKGAPAFHILPIFLFFIGRAVFFRAVMTIGLFQPLDTLIEGYIEQNEQLSEGSSQLNAILSNTDQGFILIDPNLRVKTFNKAASDLLKQLIGLTLVEGFDINDPALTGPPERLAKALTTLGTGESISGEMALTDLAGNHRWVYYTINPLVIDEQLTSFLFNLVEVTRRKEAELVLSRNEHNLNEAQRITNVGSFQHTLSNNKTWWSKQAREMLGFAESDVNRNLMIAPVGLFPEDRLAWSALLTLGSDERTGLDFRYRLETSSGLRFHELFAQLVPADDDKSMMIEGTIRDITERTLEEEMRSAMLALSQLSISATSLNDYFDHVYEAVSKQIICDDFYIALFHRNVAEWEYIFYNHSLNTMEGQRRPAGRRLPDYILQKQVPLHITKQELEKLIESNEIEPFEIFFESWTGFPLLSKDEFYGTVSFLNFRKDYVLTKEQNDFMQFVASQMAQVINRNRNLLDLQTISLHDSLTGLYNRFYYDDHIKRLQNSRLFPISTISLDLDQLKRINDTHGHYTGDKALVDLAKVMRASFRQEDVIARVGGDEFVVVLPSTDERQCQTAIARFSANLAKFNESATIPLDLSYGFCTAFQGDYLSECIKRADDNMYEHKRSKQLHSPNTISEQL